MSQPIENTAEEAPPASDVAIKADNAQQPSDRVDLSSNIDRDALLPFVASGLIAGLTGQLPPAPSTSVPAIESRINKTAAKVTPRSGRFQSVQSATAMPVCSVSWPFKKDLLGVEISVTDYDELCRLFITAAQQREPALASFLPVHGVVTAAMDPAYRHRINSFDVIAPDGQPVRWALNWLHNAQLPDRVSGPELMLKLCDHAAREGVGIYLYGSTGDTLDNLRANLEALYPNLQIVGTESPPFRQLTQNENDAAIDRINASGAGLVFIGLGLPRQDFFAYNNRHRINAVQLCVGAAFDFHAGKKKLAPPWMQKSGLEWTYRLIQEPRRLWKRYLVTNTMFVYLMTKRLLRGA